MDAPDIKTPTVAFLDGDEMHDIYPRTFEIPSARRKAAIRPGDSVKVCAAGERFWLLVTSTAYCEIVGTVDNDLVRTEEHGLAYGDLVRVEPRHVIALECRGGVA